MEFIKLLVNSCYNTNSVVFDGAIKKYRYVNRNSISYFSGPLYDDDNDNEGFKRLYNDLMNKQDDDNVPNDYVKGIKIHLIGGEVLFVANESINSLKEKLK